ncbi:Aminopeptidase N [Triplophysa tibetana]|uniref:Aminopeptidase N n=1 Tax=Triplophysa tibetana TaxID=1572043 RepID=A0A5A9PP08_9TELE|nr:Aminopeptidase N [Triplophysa tibetana]
MGKGFYIGKRLRLVFLVLGISAVVSILALSVIYSQEKRKSNKPWDKYRLPDSLSPQFYNVTLWPRLVMDERGMYFFTGTSGVAFTCLKETDLILIHSSKLNYTLTPQSHHAMLTGLGGTLAPAIVKTWLQTQTQFMVIHLKDKLQVGKSYWLHTEFRGELSDDLGGFYRSEYVENGVKKVLATTQLQPTDARKAFPCFDEPAMKAVFHITLLHPPETVALSNGMELGTEIIIINNQEVLRTRFEPSAKMSSYLLAFVVSEFTNIQSSPEADILINIALPDFSAGAMENWGLVTYRETSLLYDPKVSSIANRQLVATVISHELAHMWFGNLVTMRWWNNVWLNEGFATYVSYLGADYAEPTWNIKDLMVLHELQGVFEVDALVSSHPLSSREDEISTPAHINGLFDTITYSKGAMVLRMLSEFLSEPIFAKGLSNYLQQFAYSTTVYTDLWKKLQEVVDGDSSVHLPESIKEIMNRWILQMGYPVVTVNTNTGGISQQHFLMDSEAKVDSPSEYNYEWYVPITWMKKGVNMGQHWLLSKTATHEPMRTNTEWVLANVNVTGYFRVNYDPQNWERLLTQLSLDHKMYLRGKVQPLFDHFRVITSNWTQIPSGHMDRIHPDLKRTVYCNAIASGGVEEWDFGWKMFKNASIAAEAMTLLFALSCSKEPWLLNRQAKVIDRGFDALRPPERFR